MWGLSSWQCICPVDVFCVAHTASQPAGLWHTHTSSGKSNRPASTPLPSLPPPLLVSCALLLLLCVAHNLQEAALARVKAQQEAAFVQFADDSMDTDEEEEQTAAAAADPAAGSQAGAQQVKGGQIQQQQQQQQSDRSASQELAALAAAAAGCLPADMQCPGQQQQQGGVAASSVSVVSCGLQEVSGECVVCRAADSSKGPLALLAFVQVRLLLCDGGRVFLGGLGCSKQEDRGPACRTISLFELEREL